LIRALYPVSPCTLTCRSRTVESLPPEYLYRSQRDLRAPSFAEADAETQQAAARLAGIRDHASHDEVQAAVGVARSARMLADKARQYAGRSEIVAELHGLRIGQVALVAFPGKPLSEIGARVKASLPFRHTLFSGYTNDYLGYVPIADAYPEGGYEVDTSPYQPDTADPFVEGNLALLRDLADG
jgi:hypothetical protein